MKKTEIEKVAREAGLPMDERMEALRELYPEAFSEGAVDCKKLKQTLGDLADDSPERYSFSWAGKRDAIRLLQMPSRATLEPAPDESVNWDKTKNIFIEGDNLEVLKLMLKPYYGRVKMIYIDPPYNTGKERLYVDNYADPLEAYMVRSGMKDDDGNLTTTNVEVAGRVHSRWLSIIYPRLFLARQLLSEDGVIFISIDDHEVHNLRRVCDEIFGEENLLAQLVWRTDGNFDNQAKFKKCHEYILVYAKNEVQFAHPPVIDPSTPEASKLKKDVIRNTIVKNGPKNPVSTIQLPAGFPSEFPNGSIKARTDAWPHYLSDAKVKDGRLVEAVAVSSGWSSRDLIDQYIQNDCQPITDSKGQETRFVLTRTGAIEAIKQRRDEQSHVITVLTNLGGPQRAASELEELGVVFGDYPKPTSLLKYLIRMNKGDDFIALDFFAGSSSTAHAVLEANREDGGNRKFIMVQWPEPLSMEVEAQRASFKYCEKLGLEPHIASISKERIRRVIKKLKADKDAKLKLADGVTEDLGFRIFKLTESNYKQWTGVEDKDAEKYAEQMEAFADPLKDKWEPESVIYEVAIKEGFGLWLSYEPVASIKSNKVFRVSDFDKEQSFLICLDDTLDEKTPSALELQKDDLFVCRDIALTDELAANLALQCRLKTV